MASENDINIGVNVDDSQLDGLNQKLDRTAKTTDSVSKSTDKASGSQSKMAGVLDGLKKKVDGSGDGFQKLGTGLKGFGQVLSDNVSLVEDSADVIGGLTQLLTPQQLGFAAVAAAVGLLIVNAEKISKLFKEVTIPKVIEFGKSLGDLQTDLKNVTESIDKMREAGITNLETLNAYKDARIKLLNTEQAITKEQEKQAKILLAQQSTPTEAANKAERGKEFTEHLDDETGKTQADLRSGLVAKFAEQEKAKIAANQQDIAAQIKAIEDKHAGEPGYIKAQSADFITRIPALKAQQEALQQRSFDIRAGNSAELKPLQDKADALIGGARQGDSKDLDQIANLMSGTKWVQIVDDVKNETLKKAEEDDKKNEELAKKTAEKRKRAEEKRKRAEEKARKDRDQFIDELNAEGEENERQMNADMTKLSEAEKAERKKVSTEAAGKFQTVFNQEQAGLDQLRITDPRAARERAKQLSGALRQQLVGDANEHGPLFDVPAVDREATINETMGRLSDTYQAQVKDTQRASGEKGREGLQAAIMQVGTVASETIDKTAELQTMVQGLYSKVQGMRGRQQQTRSQLSR